MRIENTPYARQATYERALAVGPQPTAAQEQRRARLKRFNRLTIALPVGLTALLWIGLVLALIWLSVAGEWFAIDTNQEYYRGLFSGVADIVTMILLTPLMVLCAVPIAGAIALVVYRRQKRKESAVEQPSLPIFWRIENKVIAVHDAVARTTPRLARPVINMHATTAFLRQLASEVERFIKQEILRNDDER